MSPVEGRPAVAAIPGVDRLRVISIALLCGALCLWKLFEYDVFWQIRLGDELLRGHAIGIDRWSYTVRGHIWYPLHSLSYVLFAVVHRLAGYGGLCVLRGAIVFAWVALLASLTARITPPGEIRSLAVPVLPAILFLICQWEILLRPDLISLLLFTALIHTGARQPAPRSRWLRWGLLWLWANVHAGTYPIGFAVMALEVVTDRSLRPLQRLAWICAAAGLWLATLGGPAVWRGVIGNTVAYADRQSWMRDPVMESFSWRLLRFGYRGWAYRLWIVYSTAITAAIGLIASGRWSSRLPGPYASRGYSIAGWALLTALGLRYVRAIPYQVCFAVPIAAGIAAALGRSLARQPARWRLAAATIGAIALGLVFGLCLPDDLLRLPAYAWGLGINADALPMRAVRFLADQSPPGQLLNHIDWGGLVLMEAPQFPVSSDGRNLVFTPFLHEQASTPSSAYSDFLRRWGVGTVLEKWDGNGERLSRLYPDRDWALVFFDNTALIFVRRLPAQAAWIRRYEYTQLRRDWPWERVRQAALSASGTSRFASELHRCLESDPHDAFCRRIEACQLRAAGNLPGALSDLAIARAVEPWNTELLGEEHDVLRALGRAGEARALCRWIERLRPSSEGSACGAT
jgi:hypothetical protein